MNDPHVEELYYRFISENPSDRFEEASPLTAKLGLFDIELKDGVLAARPQEHYAGADEAKAVLEPYLRSWESLAFLDSSRCRIRFAFAHAKVVDRTPAVGVITLSAKISSAVMVAERVTLVRSMNNYPPPGEAFMPSSLTEELVNRLKQYQDGRESLPVVAHYVLEKLEVEFVGKNQKNVRQKLGRELGVDGDVLKRLGGLSNVPDPTIGRHAARRVFRIKSDELRWMEEVIFRLVRRVGEIDAGVQPLSQITMADFPSIS